MKIVSLSLILILSLGTLEIGAQDAPKPLDVSLGADFSLLNNVPDLRYRREVREDLFGNREPVPAQRYRVLNQNFHLNFLLQNDSSYTSGLQFWVGFRNANGGNDASPSGSEFSGWRVLLRQSFFGGYLLNSLGYGSLQSSYLRLTAKHREYQFRLDFVPDPTAQDPSKSPFFVKVGPEIVAAIGHNPGDTFGVQWGFNMLLRYQTLPIPSLPLSFGLESLFRRHDHYKILGERFRGAGILTLSPQIEWMLVENLWLGFKFHFPVFRPENREEAFSDPELPGLYGNSFQFTVKTASF